MLLGIGEQPNWPAGDGIEITLNPAASTLDEPSCPPRGRYPEPPAPGRVPEPAADVVAGCPGPFLSPRGPTTADGMEIGLTSESNPATLVSDACRRGSGGVFSCPPGFPACAIAVADVVAVPTAVRSPVPFSPRPPPRPPIPTPPKPPSPSPPNPSSTGNPNGIPPAAWIASRRTLSMSSPAFLAPPPPPPLLSTIPLLPPLFRRRLLSL